jgi:hypothetical protein
MKNGIYSIYSSYVKRTHRGYMALINGYHSFLMSLEERKNTKVYIHLEINIMFNDNYI